MHPVKLQRSLWFCTWIHLSVESVVYLRMAETCFQGAQVLRARSVSRSLQETLDANQESILEKGRTQAKALSHEAGSPVWNGVEARARSEGTQQVRGWREEGQSKGMNHLYTDPRRWTSSTRSGKLEGF